MAVLVKESVAKFWRLKMSRLWLKLINLGSHMRFGWFRRQKDSLPIAITRCPNCGHKGTVAKLVQEIKGGDGVPFLKRTFTPLENPQTAVLKVSTLIYSYDMCARCGWEYPTLIEIQDLPVRVGSVPPPPGQMAR